MLPIGHKAPAFELPSSTGDTLSLKDLAGRFAVIVFYPKNNTPGCDLQLTTLEQYRLKFEAVNTRVLAVNSASAAAHKSYCEEKGFGFPILSDPGEQVLAMYKSQKPEGKGVIRTVYALDPAGRVIFAERGQASFDAVIEKIKSMS